MTLIKSISGIRGTIGGNPGDSLSPLDVIKYSIAFGRWTKSKAGINKIVIGRDARKSGEMVRNLIAGALQSIGIDVIDLGISTTPTVEIAVVGECAGGGIVITASHNPMEWNALKLLDNKGEFISEDFGKFILNAAEKADIFSNFADIDSLGKVCFNDQYLEKHIQQILDLDLVDTLSISEAKFSVVVDPVNSSGGIFVEKLLYALGVNKVKIINAEVNGEFAHNPEPLPSHLHELADQVLINEADMGIAVDPDVDRLCFVMENGEFFGEEYTLVSIADYVLSNTPGDTVSNLSSTRALSDVTKQYSTKYHAAAVGEVNVVNKMKATNAIIGGEGNGGIIYPKLHHGRDALVGIALFLSYVAKKRLSLSELRKIYPSYYMSKKKILLTGDVNILSILEIVAEMYSREKCTTIDGLKIDFQEEWVHLRQSNTEPIIRIYAESTTNSRAEKLADDFIAIISSVIKIDKKFH